LHCLLVVHAILLMTYEILQSHLGTRREPAEQAFSLELIFGASSDRVRASRAPTCGHATESDVLQFLVDLGSHNRISVHLKP
jgi:hypothetical protein